MLKNFRYSTKFQAFARTVSINNENKKLAIASLRELAKVFDEGIAKKIENNPDLLFISSNLLLCDHINLNGDAVRKNDIIKIYDNFKCKPLDRSHNREEIIGAIYDSGFSIYPTNKIISIEEATKSEEPIQMVIGGYLWKLIDPELCEFIANASDEKSPNFGLISTSFELLFDSYDICIGTNGNTDINDAKIIKPDDPSYEKYDKILKCNGGSGMEGDNIVGRILTGEIIPAGAGLVTKPASGLKGILALTNSQDDDIDEDNELEESYKEWLKNAPQSGVGYHLCDIEMNDGKSYSNVAILNCSITPKSINTKNIKSLKLSDKNIKIENACVNDNINQIDKKNTNIAMQIKDLSELDTNWSEIRKMETSASVREFIENQLAKVSEKFSKENKEKEGVLKTIEANKTEAENKVKELQDAVNKLTDHLNKIKAEEDARAASEKFNERMANLDKTFHLEADERTLMADDVKKMGHDTCGDEMYAAYVDKQKKLMKEKTHDHINKVNKEKEEMEAKLAKAGIKEEPKVDVKAVIASVSDPKQDMPNSVMPNANETLVEQYKRVFGDSLTIGKIPSKKLIKNK